MSDLSTFNPDSVDALFDRLVADVRGEAADWWTKNRELMTGYFRSLGEATLQTTKALAEGRISEQQANRAFRSQKLAFEQTLEFSEFMTLVLAQRLLDTVFRILGWVVFNRTGINLAPHLVTPDA